MVFWDLFLYTETPHWKMLTIDFLCCHRVGRFRVVLSILDPSLATDPQCDGGSEWRNVINLSISPDLFARVARFRLCCVEALPSQVKSEPSPTRNYPTEGDHPGQIFRLYRIRDHFIEKQGRYWRSRHGNQQMWRGTKGNRYQLLVVGCDEGSFSSQTLH